MNQDRQEAYLNLIEQVLTCPKGQEPEILGASPELIDAGLVQMLLQVSTALTHEGDADAADFLVQLARLLAKSLGLSPQLTVPGSVAEGNAG
ncbi:MAG: hypothetical protein ACM37W_00160 [Actinomycetota bacterium]